MKNIAAFVLVFALLVATGCIREEKVTLQQEAITWDVNVERAQDVEIIYSDSALVRVTIAGPTMLYYANNREPQQEFPDGVQVDFYDAEGQRTSTLTGKYGIRQEARGLVIVRDSVVWRSINNETLETEELIWEERMQRVYNHKFVVVTRPDEIIYGHGFEATQDFKYSRINAIEGRIKVEEPNDEP